MRYRCFIVSLFSQAVVSASFMQRDMFNFLRKCINKNLEEGYINTHPFFLPVLAKYDNQKMYESIFAVLGDGVFWSVLYPLFNLFLIYIVLINRNLYFILGIALLDSLIILYIRWYLFFVGDIEKTISFLSNTIIKKSKEWESIIIAFFLAIVVFFFFDIKVLLELKDALMFAVLLIVLFFYSKKSLNEWLFYGILGIIVLLINGLAILM